MDVMRLQHKAYISLYPGQHKSTGCTELVISVAALVFSLDCQDIFDTW